MIGALPALEAASSGANRIVETALLVLGIFMAALMGVQVVSRYAFNYSLFWSEEIGRVCLVWITFLGASAAYKRNLHIGIDFLVSRFPKGVQRAVEAAVIAVSLVFFSVLFVYGAKFAAFVSAQRMTTVDIPLSVPYAVIPVSGALFLLHGLCRLLSLFDPRRAGGPR